MALSEVSLEMLHKIKGIICTRKKIYIYQASKQNFDKNKPIFD
jgi:hypothetical protein